jgi:hypothetical protein
MANQEFDAIKTRNLVFQNNSDGSYPTYGSLLNASDTRGTITPTRDLSINSVSTGSINSTNIQTVNLAVSNTATFSTPTTATLNSTSITSYQDIRATNANIYATGDGNLTGSVQAEYITFPDLITGVEHYLWVQNDNLNWESINGHQVNLGEALWKLRQEPTEPLTPMDLLPSGATNSQIVSTLNNLMILLSNRQAFIVARDPVVQTPNAIMFGPLIITPTGFTVNWFADPLSASYNLYIDTTQQLLRTSTNLSYTFVASSSNIFPYDIEVGGVNGLGIQGPLSAISVSVLNLNTSNSDPSNYYGINTTAYYRATVSGTTMNPITNYLLLSTEEQPNQVALQTNYTIVVSGSNASVGTPIQGVQWNGSTYQNVGHPIITIGTYTYLFTYDSGSPAESYWSLAP